MSDGNYFELVSRIPAQGYANLLKHICVRTAEQVRNHDELICKVKIYDRSGFLIEGTPVKLEQVDDDYQLILLKSDVTDPHLSFTIMNVSSIAAITFIEAHTALRALSHGHLSFDGLPPHYTTVEAKRKLQDMHQTWLEIWQGTIDVSWNSFDDSSDCRAQIVMIVEKLRNCLYRITRDKIGQAAFARINHMTLVGVPLRQLAVTRSDSELQIQIDLSVPLPLELDGFLETEILKVL